MMEISNYGAAPIAALAGGTRAPATASTAEKVANRLPEQARIAASPKASSSSFTHNTTVQKEALKWETFAAETFEAMKIEMNYYNHMLKYDDAYWARKEEVFGPEHVERTKKYVKERLAATEGNLAEMQQGLVDNGFVISGAIYQKNNLGEFEFGDFEVSKSGFGYELLFKGPDESDIDYRPAWPSRGHDRVSMLKDDLLSVLFRERR